MKNLRLLQTFFRKPILSLHELKNSGIGLEQKTFVSVGGGIGSFCWVNILRVHGVAQSNIAVVAQNRCSYLQFKHYCDHSGLSPQDRLRSDSGARPDNFWGFPGYAVSEFLDDLRTGKLLAAVKVAWQIFAEPFACDFYTPTAGRVYASIEREGLRIGWGAMVRQGSGLFLRKLSDGRLAVFYEDPTKDIRIVIANIVHLALGHTIRRSDYLLTTPTKQVSSGYELDEDFFRTVEKTGGSVVVVGRGIVAARIIERLLPRDNLLPKREVISLFRKPFEAATDSRNIKQAKLADWRLQAFNWPRSTFAGQLTDKFKRANPIERQQLAKAWSAASTPPRKQWLRDLEKAYHAKDYQYVYGQIARIEQQDARLAIAITPYSKEACNAIVSQKSFVPHPPGQGPGGFPDKTFLDSYMTIETDYLIDCSGFDDHIAQHFLYADLMTTYQLPVTLVGSLQVNDYFEIEALSSANGKVFVMGSGAAGNHYGPVDSFFGHQYAAIQSMEKLTTLPWTGARKLNAVSSTYGWLHWVLNQPI
jgi:hypothetical protein